MSNKKTTANDGSTGSTGGTTLSLDDSDIKKIIDTISDMVFICEDGLIKYVNPLGMVILGVEDEDDLTNTPFQSLIADDYASIVDDILSMLVLEHRPTAMRIKCFDGRQLSVRMEVVTLNHNKNNRTLVVAQDITHQVKLTEGMHRSETRFKKLVDSSLNFICVCDKDGVITYVNESGVKIMCAKSDADILGKSLHEFLQADYRDFILTGIHALLDSDEPLPIRFLNIDGGIIDADVSFTKLSGGKDFSYKVEARDITARNNAVSALRRSIETLEQRVEERTRELQEEVSIRRQAEEKMRHMASHDDLTKLPNRALMLDRLDVAIRRSHREKKLCGVAFIDLDGFKAVNDTMGHEAGDKLLCAVAEKLLKCVRETDTVARIGGDEFVLILPDMHTRDNAELVAKRVIEILSQPIDVGSSKKAAIGASIGIAMFPANSDNPEALLKLADKAMYKVKGKGKNDFAFVD